MRLEERYLIGTAVFYPGVILTSNEIVSRYFAYADHENTIGIQQIHKLSKWREKEIFRRFFMGF